ncbi:hypothetical protein O181_071906 [Austropuccinia psidii MF-1]|uniref:Tc1-like transposase DDE domain-containing protein n=1 Tax=Austropuccinia psidii MF-1 TaxID=1389203 RepID=A0A9Q3F866_9BASI|nr:hypothetical protein [Austropuccinia psidii MF-1]
MVQRVLHKEGIFSRIAVVKPHLRPQHFAKLLAFARAHVDWSLEEWKKVIWTDERSFDLSKNPTPIAFGELRSIMVWEGFCDTEQSPLIIMGSNARRTQGFIDNVYSIGLLPFYNYLQQKQPAPQRQAFTLCEDNAPVHTSLLSCRWRDSQGIVKFQWQSNSPNLNPIENAWKKMKVIFHK